MEPKRRQQFRRNVRLEGLLRRIDSLLSPLEDQILADFAMPRFPVVLVLGAARSGTTLLMQWLASTDRFAYPTNLLSRFYGSPFVGALIQQLLTSPDYDHGDELRTFAHDISFESDLGKTRGALAPNEFWYFWRRFFPITVPEHMDEESLRQADSRTFTAELAAIESVFDKPLAMKGMILEFNIPFLSSILDKALFLYVDRAPFYNIQSLLESRVRFSGDRREWYSVKPREYEYLRDLDPIEQVAGQVYFTNRAIGEGLAQIDEGRGLTISYEEFCAAPGDVFRQIAAKLAHQGYDALADYVGPDSFQSTNQVRLAREDCDQIIAAYKRFSGVEITT